MPIPECIKQGDATMNTLYYGDNLEVLRKKVKDETIDLCYIDPPFNSKRNYFQIYNNIGGEDRAQAQAFVDTWEWGEEADRGFQEILANDVGRFATQTVDLIKGLHPVLKKGSLLAYLISMTLRITEIHRVLKPTGSFYLHCDPTASHYLKIILDAIFVSSGGDFTLEVVWRRKGGSALKDMRGFSTATDFILYYTRSNNYTFNTVYMPMDEEYIAEHFTKTDENGRRFQATVMRSPNPRPNLMYDYKGYKMPPNGWAVSREKMEELDRLGALYFPDDKSKQIYRKIYLDQYPGQPANNLWHDIKTLKGQSQERMGYPTQKPEALLERIIRASTNEGDTILDAYCGCGTTVAVAERLKRNWIGIDITYQSISLMIKRLEGQYGKSVLATIKLDGIPQDMAAAVALANKKDDRVRKEFEKWAVLTYSQTAPSSTTKRAQTRELTASLTPSPARTPTRKSCFKSKVDTLGAATLPNSTVIAFVKMPNSPSFSRSKTQPNPCAKKRTRRASIRIP